jgi:hypothetical protein
VNVIPADGIPRLIFFMEDRMAQLRWTRADLAAAGGPSTTTMNAATQRGGRLATRTLARLDVALNWQEGSSARTVAGGSPALRISEQFSSCSAAVDAARREAEDDGVARLAGELKKFLLDVAQRLDDFYTEPRTAVGSGASGNAS